MDVLKTLLNLNARATVAARTPGTSGCVPRPKMVPKEGTRFGPKNCNPPPPYAPRLPKNIAQSRAQYHWHPFKLFEIALR